MLDHANGAPAPFIGGRRIRYAWRPVRQYITLTRPCGWIWLQEIVETRTLAEGWVAFEHDNRDYALTLKTVLLGALAHVQQGVVDGSMRPIGTFATALQAGVLGWLARASYTDAAQQEHVAREIAMLLAVGIRAIEREPANAMRF